MELAQPHENSWPAAPYHVNIPVRKSIIFDTIKWSHKLPDIRTVSINIFRSCFFWPINHVASVFSSEIFLSEKKSFRLLFFLSIKSRPITDAGWERNLIKTGWERNLSALMLRTLVVGSRQQSESIEAALDME